MCIENILRDQLMENLVSIGFFFVLSATTLEILLIRQSKSNKQCMIRIYKRSILAAILNR